MSKKVTKTTARHRSYAKITQISKKLKIKRQLQQSKMVAPQSKKKLIKQCTKNKKSQDNRSKKPKRIMKRKYCEENCQKHTYSLRSFIDNQKFFDDVNFCKRKRGRWLKLPIIPNNYYLTKCNTTLFTDQIPKNKKEVNWIQRMFLENIRKKNYTIQHEIPIPTKYPIICHHCYKAIKEKQQYQNHVRSKDHLEKWQNAPEMKEIMEIIKNFNQKKEEQRKKEITKTKQKIIKQPVKKSERLAEKTRKKL